jgi:N6-adenosine-specific RNA methylase IME4
VTKYRTIVADPPWHYDGFGVGRVPAGSTNDGRKTPLPYPTMSVAEIAALPVAEWAEDEAHLYLWTTAKYVWNARDIASAWGFMPGQLLHWCKTPMGIGPGGTWASNVEYILVARRGSLAHKRRFDSSWFNWPRMGAAHSRKPEAFLDMVEETSPGPYLELFARRQRLGWDTWGDEALNHVEIAS